MSAPVDCDVLVVGAGVAGIAIAERLSREAIRRGNPIDILVVERADSLGTCASGRLEGWYHSGALYAGFEDPTCFNAGAEGMHNIRRWYAQDDAFEARDACTIDDPDASDGWFFNQIDYLLPSRTLNGASRQSRMVERLCGESRTTVVKALLAAGDAAGAARAAERRDAISACVRLPDVDVLPSSDRVMDARRILDDLVTCAWRRGVRIESGVHVDRVRPVGAGLHEATMTQAGERRRVVTRQVIAGAGAGLAPTGSLHAMLGEDVQIEQRRSVMVVTGRAPSPASFVHMGDAADDDFSHLRHPTPTGSYSVVADSNSISLDADESAARAAAAALMRKAKRFFGDDVWNDRDARWYACTKTEVRGVAAGGNFVPWLGSAIGAAGATTEDAPLCVLPGKFSMFATLAQRVFEEMERRSLFESTSEVRAIPSAPPRVAMGYARHVAEQLDDASSERHDDDARLLIR